MSSWCHSNLKETEPPNELPNSFKHTRVPGRVAQSVTCLATDASLTADPGVVSSIVEIDDDRILQTFSSLLLNYSRSVVVGFTRKYMHEVLVNCLSKLAQEKVW